MCYFKSHSKICLWHESREFLSFQIIFIRWNEQKEIKLEYWMQERIFFVDAQLIAIAVIITNIAGINFFNIEIISFCFDSFFAVLLKLMEVVLRYCWGWIVRKIVFCVFLWLLMRIFNYLGVDSWKIDCWGWFLVPDPTQSISSLSLLSKLNINDLFFH